MKGVRKLLGMPPGRVLCAIDFGNVNHWFDDGDRGIDVRKLQAFCSLFSDDVRLYYGHDPDKPRSLAFLKLLRQAYGRAKVVTKPIQRIRPPADGRELVLKANFDVEIAVDAMRLFDSYDAYVLMSGDADFAYLMSALGQSHKKTALIRGGYIARSLRDACGVVLDAGDFREAITTRRPR